MAFPQSVLDTRVELLLSGTWQDVTSYVYQRAPVQIAYGHPDEASAVNPTSCTLTLDNRTGRFSPRNPLGAYYGSLTRNTQMRVSLPEGGTYLRMEGDGTSYASCPDAAGLDITGDLELQVDMWLSDYTNSVLASKYSISNGQSWYLKLLDSGLLYFRWYTGSGSHVTTQSTAAVPVGRFAVKTTLAVASGTVTFYTAATIAGPWTQLGTATVAGATSVHTSACSLSVGANADLAAASFYNSTPLKGANGKVYAFKLLNGIGGTVVASPTFTAQSAGTNSFADAQSNTWTLSGTAEISDRKYRAHTEVPAWPPRWDPTGADVYAPVEGSGRWRRLNAGTPPQYSAMYRAYVRLTGTTAPVAYWPCEDGNTATSLASGIGGAPMAFSGTPTLATDSSFLSSQPLPTVSGSKWTGPVPGYTAPAGAANIMRFLMKIPSASPPPTNTIIASLYTFGTVARADLVYVGSSQIELFCYSATGATLIDTGAMGITLDALLRVSVELQLSGGNVQGSMAIVQAGATIGGGLSGTTAGSIGNAYQADISPGGGLGATVIGHVSVQPAYDSLFNLGPAVNAWSGEYAGVRFARLCAEEGIASRIYGAPGGTAAMGAQTTQTAEALLQECEDADKGLIYEPRQAFGLGYRTRASMYNQAGLALSYTAAQLSAPLEPVDDDRLLVNDMTITRSSGGSSARNIAATGPLSTQAPPNGVGSYGQAKTLNLSADSQLADAAGWAVHVGTVDDLRYPTLSVNLARSELTSVYYQLQDLAVGDRVTVSGTPSWLPPDGISQIVSGGTEVCYGYVFTEQWTCVPESPYEVGVLDDATLGRLDTDGSALASGVTSTATAISVTTTAVTSPAWTVNTADYPFDLVVAGERMTATSPAPLLSTADGTFESGVAGWTAANGTIAQSSAQAHSGTHSGLLTASGSGFVTANSGAFSVTVGAAYQLVQWMRFAAGTPNYAIAFVSWRDGSGTQIGTMGNDFALVPTTSWQTQTVTGKAPAGAVTAEVYLRMSASAAADAVYYDDVALNPVSGGTQTLNVTRSVNGVVKAQSSGAAVALFQPMILGL